mmetsp:Transcript_39837/g.62160  ORF Transcript_39837/g.62160 Transcript_39837/m.62160 type:complete len:266 (-) Transcript_39837:101-898(-)
MALSSRVGALIATLWALQLAQGLAFSVGSAPSAALGVAGLASRPLSLTPSAPRVSARSLLPLRSGGPPPPPSTSPAPATNAQQGDLNIQLWEAAKNGETAEVDRLVRSGAQVNYWEAEALQATALQWAATNGHADTVQALLKLGAAPDPTNQFGWTALHHAANWGYDEVCRILLKGGADHTAKTESSKTAADCAAFKGYTNVIQVFKEHAAGQEGEASDLSYFGSDDQNAISGFTMSNTRNMRGEQDFSTWQEAWGAQFPNSPPS